MGAVRESLRLCPEATDVVVEHDHPASGADRLRVMAYDADRVRHVEQDQPTHHGVERLLVTPLRHVSLDEAHVLPAFGTGPCYCEHPRVDVEPDHLPAGTDQVRDREGHVTQAGTEVEHAHARAYSRKSPAAHASVRG